jgi:transposase
MARLTENDKKIILADYHTNKYSQRDLAKKYNVSLGTISNLTKEVTPQNEHLVNAQIAVLSAKANLENEQLNAIMNTAQELAFNKELVYNVTQKALKKLDKLLDEADNADDINTIIQASDKASLTLGVNQRHAPKAETKVDVSQTNAVQFNIDLNND